MDRPEGKAQRQRQFNSFQAGFMAGARMLAIDESRRSTDPDYDAGVKEGLAVREAALKRARDKYEV